MKTALVCGAAGFIGHHLVNRLERDGFAPICMADIASAGQFDLRLQGHTAKLFQEIKDDGLQPDEVYQLAANMGGAGYIFSGDHDAEVMWDSAMINLNVLDAARGYGVKKIFFSSSACVYNTDLQQWPRHYVKLSEKMAYPAMPDHDYGWEKLFSERLYQAYHRNYGMDVKIARFHTIYGPEGTWQGGREKAPAALCRKVIEAIDQGKDYIEVWGDGKQRRSFLYIDDCLDAVRLLMESDFGGPVNIGSEEMVTINDLAHLIMEIAGKELQIRHVAGPVGVHARCSDNTLIKRMLGWEPKVSLRAGMIETYNWIKGEYERAE